MKRIRGFVLGMSFILVTVSVHATDVTITNTIPQPTTMNACPGSTVNALVVRVTNNDAIPVSINSWGFLFNGTGSTSDFTSNFYLDSNQNGLVDGSDFNFGAVSGWMNFLGPWSCYWENGEYNTPIPVGGSVCFILAVTFNSSAPVGNTYQFKMDPSQLWGLVTIYTVTDNSTSTLFTLTNCSAGTSTPTFTSTATATLTDTNTTTYTFSPTRTPTSTGSTATFTPTITSTATSVSTYTPTATGETATLTSTGTMTDTPTITATPTMTSTQTGTFSPTQTACQTDTSTITDTPTLTVSSTCTLTPTWTPLNRVLISEPYPNPSSGMPVQMDVTTPEAGAIEMQVFTTAFRKVSDHFFTTGGSAGLAGIKTTIQWDLHDKQNRMVANGLYYVCVRTSGVYESNHIFKVLVIR